MTKPRDDSPFPISLDQPDVQVSRNRVAIWLDVSPDTVRRIEDGPEWVYITERLERSSAHGWIRWLLRKQEEQRAALAAAQAALPAGPRLRHLRAGVARPDPQTRSLDRRP